MTILFSLIHSRRLQRWQSILSLLRFLAMSCRQEEEEKKQILHKADDVFDLEQQRDRKNLEFHFDLLQEVTLKTPLDA